MGVAVAAVIVTALLVWNLSTNLTPRSQQITQQSEIENFETQFTKYFTRTNEWTFVKSTSVFHTYIKESDFTVENDRKVWNKVLFELDPDINYDEANIKNTQQKAIVVYPTFTTSAYTEPGFYTFYRGECNSSCLTIQIKNNFLPQSNPNAVQVLRLLGYDFTTDVDVDKDPSILAKYDKVIILHNEYVTKKEFDAITSHPNVIYLYPNALYAEVKSDYDKNTIMLIRGHNYPSQEIRNGYDWKFDNSELEYALDCKNMEFNRIDNGWMLNCYPENVIHKNMDLLKIIKKL